MTYGDGWDYRLLIGQRNFASEKENGKLTNHGLMFDVLGLGSTAVYTA